jgi:septation ring formation regulator EzrA
LNDRIAQLTQSLSREQAEKSKVEQQFAQVKSTLAATEVQRDQYKDLSDDFGSSVVIARDTITKLTGELDAERKALRRSALLGSPTPFRRRAEKSKAEQQLTQLKLALAASKLNGIDTKAKMTISTATWCLRRRLSCSRPNSMPRRRIRSTQNASAAH